MRKLHNALTLLGEIGSVIVIISETSERIISIFKK